MITSNIQPQEYSRGGGIDDTLYKTATRTAISTCAICIGMMVRGIGVTTGLTMTLMTTILLVFSQIYSFLSHLFGRVLFCNLSTPPTEHFPDFI
jgi:hypothetical protein